MSETSTYNPNDYIKWGGNDFWVDRAANSLRVIEIDLLGSETAEEWQKEMLDSSASMLADVLRHMGALPKATFITPTVLKDAVLTEKDRIFYQPLRDLDALVSEHVIPENEPTLF